MNKKLENFIFSEEHPDSHILRFSEYRRGSNEYGQLFKDLMMILRLKQEKDKDEIILNKKDLKNIDLYKLIKLSKNIKEMRKLGMSFDIEIKGDKMRFYNLNKVNKEYHLENNNIK